MAHAATHGWEAALFARVAGGMRYDLAGIETLLAALGGPERGLRVVSVGGTNGKGTTSYLLARALQAAGVRAGLFTSPHLIAFGERIQVAGRPLAPARAEALYARLVALEPRLPRPFSFFEATLAMACLAFAEDGVALAVMEAGLGGRLDATNIFAAEARLACVTTRIDLDHQILLGNDRVAIAHEKAGLWRRGRPAVVGPQSPAVRAALAARAKTAGVPVHFVDDAEVAQAGTALPATRAWPAFLQENAAVARAALRPLSVQGVAVTDAHLAAATQRFAWPGRYHRLRPAGAAGPDVVLDAGHNPGGVRALAAALSADAAFAGRPKAGILGALRDKDLTQMVRALRPAVDKLVLCGIGEGARARDAAALRHSFRELLAHDDVEAALARVLVEARLDGVVVVTGSLRLVGNALRWLRARQFVDVSRGA